jgi:hypothetical protein
MKKLFSALKNGFFLKIFQLGTRQTFRRLTIEDGADIT